LHVGKSGVAARDLCTNADPRKPLPIGSLRLTGDHMNNQLAFVITLAMLIAGLIIWSVV